MKVKKDMAFKSKKRKPQKKIIGKNTLLKIETDSRDDSRLKRYKHCAIIIVR